MKEKKSSPQKLGEENEEEEEKLNKGNSSPRNVRDVSEEKEEKPDEADKSLPKMWTMAAKNKKRSLMMEITPQQEI